MARFQSSLRSMPLVAFGLNHQTAPIAIREKLAFPAESLDEALRGMIGSHAVREAAILSTCNRTEIYCNAADVDQALAWTAEFHRLPLDSFKPYLYVYDAADAARHAFRVASGLDSMVLGETQILGQLKDAVRTAESAGSLGTLLNHLFQRTFAVAKEVRSQTAIGANSVSMAAAAVRLAEQIFPSVRELNVLFVGAGEMIELVATHFAASQPKSITVANRTLERGQKLASQFGGHAIVLNELPEQLSRFDVVVTSTAAPLPILGKGMVERALKARRHRPMFMLDLAVPRDIEPEVETLDDVFLYTVDDIAAVVDAGREERRQAAAAAEVIIADKTREFLDWIDGRSAVPVVRALRDHGERVRRHALEAAHKRLERGDNPAEVLESLSVQLTNKLLHPPTAALSSARGDERDRMIDAVSRLYDLHPD